MKWKCTRCHCCRDFVLINATFATRMWHNYTQTYHTSSESHSRRYYKNWIPGLIPPWTLEVLQPKIACSSKSIFFSQLDCDTKINTCKTAIRKWFIINLSIKDFFSQENPQKISLFPVTSQCCMCCVSAQDTIASFSMGRHII